MKAVRNTAFAALACLLSGAALSQQIGDARGHVEHVSLTIQPRAGVCGTAAGGQGSTSAFAGMLRRACADAASSYRTAPPRMRPSGPDAVSAPNLSGFVYQAGANPFVAGGLGGQCTAFAFGRALEVTGKAMDFTGRPKDWVANTRYPTGSTPRAGAIAVWAGIAAGMTGHVAFVESVQNGAVTITEANVNTFNNSLYGGGYDGSPRTFTENQMADRSAPETGQVGKLLGYIYLQ